MNLEAETIKAVKLDQRVPEGYKRAEVGVIPKDWEVYTIGQIGSVQGGGTPSSFTASYWNGNINWFTPSEIGKKKYVSESLSKITAEGLTNSSAAVLPKGSVLLTSRAGIGKTAILLKEGCTNQGFQSIIPKGIDREFLYYLINTGFFQSALIDGASGSTFLEIDPATLKSIKIPVPSSAKEQTAIATALSDVDNLIESLDKLIAKKKAIKQATMQQLLTGKKRLPGFSGEWETKRVGDIGQFQGGTGFPIKHQGDKTGDYPFYKVSDIGNNKSNPFISNSNNYIKEEIRKRIGAKLIPYGSIIFAKIGAAIFLERKKIVSQPSCIDNNMDAFILNDSSNNFKFIYYWFVYNKLGNIVTTTALPSLSKEALSALKIDLPQVIEQSRIAQVLSDMDAEIEALEKRKAKTQQIKEGMMQELLTGKTRLI